MMISGGRYHLDVMWLDRHLVYFCLFGLSYISCSDIIWRRETRELWILVTLSSVGSFLTGMLPLIEASPLFWGVLEYMFCFEEYLCGDLNVEFFLPNELEITDLFDNALWCFYFEGVIISTCLFG